MFRDGDLVTLTDASGVEHIGVLWLPPVKYFSRDGESVREQSTGGGYAIYTIIRADRKRFRTEGRLS